MSSPLPTLVICLTYIMIVKIWGPNYMKNRPAFQLYNALILYNFVQVLVSAYSFYGVILKKIISVISYFGLKICGGCSGDLMKFRLIP